MRGTNEPCGCFPTGRHYPGIADLIAKSVQEVKGLCAQFSAQDDWRRLPVAVIDFETTGTNPESDRVLEIGIVCFDNGKVSSREGLLINPGIPVPEESRAVHGISDEELSGAPSFAETLPTILKLLQGRVPIAYNANFDRAFLTQEIARVEAELHEPIDWPPACQEEVTWIDPLVWARQILSQLKSKRLSEVAKHFGISLEQAHRAAGDAEATGKVLYALAPQMPRAYGELIRLQDRYAAIQEVEMASWKRKRT